MAAYQGHRSWNAWNVSHWIGNDEPLYKAAVECIAWARANTSPHRTLRPPDKIEDVIARRAAFRFHRICMPYGERTPDGAVYNRLAVKLAMLGLMD